MNNQIFLQTVKRRLQENNLVYEELPLQNGYTVLCTQRGGRILGPFDPDTGESVWWMNSALKDKEDFRAFLKSDDWNIGGDRLWVEPEMPLFVPDRTDFFNSYLVQPQIDPGNYTLKRTAADVSMTQQVTAKTFQVDCSQKRFTVTRDIRQAADPLRSHPNGRALSQGVMHCGLRQRVALTVIDQDTNVYLEPWILTQVNPKGRLLVPCIGAADFVDYYEPIPASMYRKCGTVLDVDVTGNHRFKLGFRAVQTMGRSGYFGRLSNGQSYLFVRFYGNNPSNTYCGDPFDRPDLYGCSLYLYNDSGNLGGFAEYENAGTTISGDTGLRTASDDVTYHLYFGELNAVQAISRKLLGV